MSGLRSDLPPPRGEWLERLPLWRRSPLPAVAATLGLTVAALLLRLAAEPLLYNRVPFITFFTAVITAAFLFGARMGVVAALVGGVLAYLFVIGVQPDVTPAEAAPELLLYALMCAVMVKIVHWMQRTSARLRRERAVSASLADTRAALFRELQHRVSNNLQVVAALLTLQKRKVEDPAARAALDEASRRIGLVGRIHRKLYEPTGARIGMATFLRELSADVLDSTGRDGVVVEVNADERLELHADAAIPVALIVAEAIANAVEHGFSGREQGRVGISLARGGDGSIVLNVTDDGIGLPAGFDMGRESSLGLGIALTLARQLGGEFNLVTEQGTCARLRLPAKTAL